MSTTVDFHSHRVQLVLAALSASLVTSGLFSAYNAYTYRKRRRALDDDVKRSLTLPPSKDLPNLSGRPHSEDLIMLGSTTDSLESKAATLAAGDGEYDEELIREQLARNYAFFRDEGMARIRKGTVVIVGCGGVGSWAAVMLVRSGIAKIRLVDFDYVTLSSLNRHATATLADVGTPKVKCIERTLKQFSRWVEVESCVDIWRKEEGGKLLEGADWVIDAIDNITTKVDLLKYCHSHGIKVFSSMGAGAKCDPTRIQISDISHTIYDPLARSVRRRLRLEGVSSGIPVVYSTEVPGDVKLLPLPEDEFQKGNVKELGVFDDFRVRILPVIGPLPSMFGLHIATYVLCEIAGKPIVNPLPIKNRRKVYERLLRDLLSRETKLAGQTINKLPIDEDDVSLVFEDIHKGRSLIPPHPVPARPTLVRWDLNKPLTLENVVVMEFPEAEKHLKTLLDEPQKRPSDVWGDEVEAIVQRNNIEVQKYREWVGL
ncbi:ubiquitin-protein ligase molybdopterin-converting factor [Coniophora puteana RWD-64-598 SS2]|uniref:Ubiquitin-protein ligase molybdopterin-converting factor n=1 Tax=Coniophora puteana (strain RWD-64-598) TaxID=741705 RepID=A0A5M3MKN1_CONPW|nr:ubiquitin-protein ligase molybdopterin-converting factor [Coniophora puteana RWD-64-598 SS2]EIW79643.1 ubiquitin-protein ligase molybdopterin-converting factor [Coniophora puteana RWD-64-598 SS2]